MNDEQVFQAWTNELQIVVDTLREDKKELQHRVTELENQIAMYKSMVDRLKLAISQGSDN
jgi:chaperonin cofactor prefoldin